MEKLPITEDLVKEILKNRKQMESDIRKKMYEINKDLFQNDELYELVSYPSTQVSDMPRRRGWHKDLTDVLIRYEKVLTDRKIQYQGILWDLVLQETQIERVWVAFQLLTEPYYTILSDLYEKNNKYEVAQQESGYSLRIFEKHRKKGIEIIIQLYNSEDDVLRLETLVSSAEKIRERMRKKNSAQNIDYQISIDDLFGELEQENKNGK